MKEQMKRIVKENIVTLVFLVLCVCGFIASGQTFSYVLSEVATRLFRNFGLVFSLIIPVIAGIGLNFGIVLGAMAAQAGYIFVTHWRIQGLLAIIVAVLICTPLSIIFGWLLGKLFNKTKGQEMITGMITGFFANGLYQMFFLVLIGTLIPMTDDRIMIYTGIGIKDTLKLEDSVVNALDNVLKLRLDQLFIPIVIIAIAVLAFCIIKTYREKLPNYKQKLWEYGVYALAVLALWIVGTCNKQVAFAMKFTSVPVVPLILMVLFGLIVNAILKTKLGQDFRAIGMNMKVAAASGIDVDKTRIIAIILSTIIVRLLQIFR